MSNFLSLFFIFQTRLKMHGMTLPATFEMALIKMNEILLFLILANV